MDLEEIDLSRLEETLPDTGFSVFHTPEALRVLNKYSSSHLRLICGFKGDCPVAVLPLFVKTLLGGRVVFSPPPGLGVRRMGPLMMPTSPKQSKREKLNREFIEKIIESVDGNSVATLLFVSCSTRYSDPRPFHWEGLNVTPSFTYHLDLRSTTPEQVIDMFSKSLRREIRNGRETDIMVRYGQHVEANKIYRATRDRFAEQGLKLSFSWEYMSELLKELGHRARIYVAESGDGSFLGGTVVLYSSDTAHFWKGGAKRSYEGISVNSMLHWKAIEDILSDPELDGIERYDFYTANNERISKYKSKFGGELKRYYRIESNSLPMIAAKKSYRAVSYRQGIL